MPYRRNALTLVILHSLYGTGAVTAATLTVDATGDSAVAPGVCNFRQAFLAAQYDMPYGTCGAGDAGADTIDFAPGMSGATITVTAGAHPLAGRFLFTTSIDVDASALTNPVTFDAATNSVSSVLDPDDNTSYGINVAFRNLHLEGSGFGQFSSNQTRLMTVTLENIEIRDFTGVAVQAQAGSRVTLDDSTITGGGSAGISCSSGIALRANGGSNLGILTVTNSTIAYNTVCNTGAVYQSGPGGTMTLTNTTISHNRNGVYGGTTPSQIRRYDDAYGDLNLINTVVANPVRTTAIGLEATGTNCGVVQNNFSFDTDTNNHFDDGTCDTPSDGAAGLEALQDNGGPTQTMGLAVGGALRDAGDTGTCMGGINYDQRGLNRSVDGNGMGGAECDIGAFEAQSVPVDLQKFEVE